MVILIRVHEMLYIVRMRLACSDYKIKDFAMNWRDSYFMLFYYEASYGISLASKSNCSNNLYRLETLEYVPKGTR